MCFIEKLLTQYNIKEKKNENQIYPVIPYQGLSSKKLTTFENFKICLCFIEKLLTQYNIKKQKNENQIYPVIPYQGLSSIFPSINSVL